MKITPYDPSKKGEILAEALFTLMSGGVVVYPTETSYAMGVDFFAPAACKKIFKIKYRERDKKLSVLVPNFTYATSLVRFSARASELAHEYWPGPLTLVLPFLYSRDWPHHGDDYLAVRVSSNPFAANLTQAFGKPITATSANMSGKPACYSADDVVQQLKEAKHMPDLIIDAGTLPKKASSTIIKDDGESLQVLREGEITITV